MACFASHVHRVQQVIDAAVTHDRKVAYVGRSMVRNMAIARELGYLTRARRACWSTPRTSPTCRRSARC